MRGRTARKVRGARGERAWKGRMGRGRDTTGRETRKAEKRRQSPESIFFFFLKEQKNKPFQLTGNVYPPKALLGREIRKRGDRK